MTEEPEVLPPGSSVHVITGVGCHFLLQQTFLTQGLNPWLLSCQAGSLPLTHQGSPYVTTDSYLISRSHLSVKQGLEAIISTEACSWDEMRPRELY